MIGCCFTICFNVGVVNTAINFFIFIYVFVAGITSPACVACDRVLTVFTCYFVVGHFIRVVVIVVVVVTGLGVGFIVVG